jgi:hypothetical protein
MHGAGGIGVYAERRGDGLTLYQVKAMRTIRKRDGSLIQRNETRSFTCDTVEEARRYFTKPDLTLLSEVKEVKP